MNSEWCRSICIIAEGDEEKYYLEKLSSMNIFNNSKIKLTSIRNAHGRDNIFPLFQDLYSNGRYDLVAIFCDGDNNSEQFQKLVNKLDHEVFGDKPVSSKIVFFVNPVTLQVVLSHFGDVKLHNKGKPVNAPEVERLTGISSYKAKEAQIKSMVSAIRFQTYDDMKKRISVLPNSINETPSTNFLKLLDILEGKAMHDLDEIIMILNSDFIL